MKKLIDDPRHVVRDMLEGTVARSPGLALLDTENVVVRRGADGARQAAIISGGGSGHEPAHAGYVGEGLLTAAVAGDVFTSPSVDAVLAALRSVAGSAGAVLVVKNYTGDRLNFGLAAEIARSEGIPVEVVTVADDVALRDTVPADRRRGIAGTVLVHKVAGAAAAAGKPLADVAALARRAIDGLGSMGIALGSCTVPAVGHPGFELGDDEIEYGLGIHGEPGVRRGSMTDAASLVDTMLGSIVADLGVRDGQRVALLVNGLGATPPMELDVVLHDALRWLSARGIVVVRAWSGNFLTALDMPGCSLSLLKVDDELLALLDVPGDAPAWPGGGRLNDTPVMPAPKRAAERTSSAPPSPAGLRVKAVAHAAAHALIDAEDELTELDRKAGDGDLGSSMRRGAEAVLALGDHAWSSPEVALRAMGDVMRRAIGGSSGPFYATGLTRAARELAGKDDPRPQEWHAALVAATEAISELGGAKAGDRTMLDALYPAAEALWQALEAGRSLDDALTAMREAAVKGARDTAGMRARAGRASYLGDRATGVPDGGAVAVTVWMGVMGRQ
ncbi:MAG: PTS-dependent dihydroxyacetone kinase, dihydroxyacetone-binding subunit DhaK [Luteibacter sp.]|uniref:dihydroxyacetone kinase family protein n=1 Tax=Luteibacter sp. TaxID=1886636 RepID=UPI0013856BCE|nr:dihydroxyacetone kinase family protein [Luteibacter sp.]KAF1009579.1 MAG: PTS-dependent dihydroxyacetone kinase, dihydroxyacetone-binding subunit DhaK [Luteibacter sp.]